MIKTLQQRLALLLLLPVALLLFFAGFFGFIYVRGIMLDQWREAAILKLERAAHHIDMRLGRPIELMEIFHTTAGNQNRYAAQEWVLKQLQGLEGVIKVNQYWLDDNGQRIMKSEKGLSMVREGTMHFHNAKIVEITSPRYDAQTGRETVAIISNLKDESGREVGRLEVVMSFDYLMKDIQTWGWWQSDKACLVDNSGRYLAHTQKMMKGRKRLGETNDPLELAVLAAMKEKPFGTLLGSGHPPDQVCGFYRIKRAPWTIILAAPGEKILAPIVRFRFYSALAGSLCILLIILLIRSVAGRLASSVTHISRAAEKVAKGDYGDPLPITGRDEIGQLAKSFNTMVQGLKERDFLSNTFGRYVDQEIARELMQRPEATRLGGEKREVAILISDIRNFTHLSESISPEKTIHILNRYFSRMIEVIQRHKGIIVDFFGDSLLVFFDPIEGPIAPMIRMAVRCALEMQGEMEDFNAQGKAEGLPNLQMGIGVNAGEVIVGNIGSETRAKYGIVGSPVNITQRIQSEAEGGEVVIPETAYHHIFKDLAVKRSFNVRLKGLEQPIQLYVIRGIQQNS
jgi:adenylate cyclase